MVDLTRRREINAVLRQSFQQRGIQEPAASASKADTVLGGTDDTLGIVRSPWSRVTWPPPLE